jgi:hypothetical protein
MGTQTTPDAIEHFAALCDCRTQVAASLSPRIIAHRIYCDAEHQDHAGAVLADQQTWPKIIHLVRHGEGTHNVMAREHRQAGLSGSPYTTDTCPMDPRLTDVGVQQVGDMLQPR